MHDVFGHVICMLMYIRDYNNAERFPLKALARTHFPAHAGTREGRFELRQYI